MAPQEAPKKLTAQEFYGKIIGPKVDVYVGKEKNHFSLPKLLTHHSPFFDKCFNGNFKEGITQKVELPEDNLSNFIVILEHIFRGNPTLVVSETRQAGVKRCIDFIEYIGKYDMGEASSAVYEPLKRILLNWGYRDNGKLAVPGSDIETVFRVCPPASPLRKLITSAALSFGGLQTPSQYRV